MRRRLLLVFSAGCVLSLAVACRSEAREQTLDDVLSDVQKWTAPEQGAVEQSSEIERTKASASVSWVNRIDSSWPEYRVFLVSQLGGEHGFQIKSEKPSQLVFSKALPADVYSVTADLLEAGLPLRVRMTFVAGAW